VVLICVDLSPSVVVLNCHVLEFTCGGSWRILPARIGISPFPVNEKTVRQI
jgi:hypothetical protein